MQVATPQRKENRRIQLKERNKTENHALHAASELSKGYFDGDDSECDGQAFRENPHRSFIKSELFRTADSTTIRFSGRGVATEKLTTYERAIIVTKKLPEEAPRVRLRTTSGDK